MNIEIKGNQQFHYGIYTLNGKKIDENYSIVELCKKYKTKNVRNAKKVIYGKRKKCNNYMFLQKPLYVNLPKYIMPYIQVGNRTLYTKGRNVLVFNLHGNKIYEADTILEIANKYEMDYDTLCKHVKGATKRYYNYMIRLKDEVGDVEQIVSYK